MPPLHIKTSGVDPTSRKKRMYLKQFIREMNTTRDTVRFYIDLQLLTPKRRGKNYWFGNQEKYAFAQVKGLQELGFSLQEIQTIKHSHDQSCGTELQWKSNLQLIAAKLQKVDQEIADLENKRAGLAQLEAVLKKKIAVQS